MRRTRLASTEASSAPCTVTSASEWATCGSICMCLSIVGTSRAPLGRSAERAIRNAAMPQHGPICRSHSRLDDASEPDRWTRHAAAHVGLVAEFAHSATACVAQKAAGLTSCRSSGGSSSRERGLRGVLHKLNMHA
eukprot:4063914-Pleurochrysis_carterae.AAC.6